MESPPMGRYIIQPSNKRRVFPGSSSSYKDSGIAEVSPIIDWSSKSKSLKQKETIGLEVTHVDVEGDSGDVMFVNDIVDQNYKGKEALSDCSYNDSDSAKVGTVDVQSSGRGPVVGLRKSSDLEGFNNEFPYHDDEYMDAYHDDLTYDRDYALQAHFDSRDIPTGVEVPVPWFLVPADTEKHSSTVNSSNNGSSSINIDTPMADSSNYWGLPDFAKAGSVSTSTSNSSLQTDLEKLNSPYNLDLTLSSPFIEPDLHISNSAGSASSTYSYSLAEMGVLSYPHAIRPQFVPPYFFGETMPPTHGSTANYTSQAQVCAVRPSSGFHPSFKGSKVHSSSMKSVGNGSLTYSLVPSMFPMPPPPPSVGTFMPSWHGDSFYLNQSSFASGDIYTPADAVPFSPEKDLIVHFVQDPASSEKSSTAAGSSAVPFGSMSHIEKHVNENEILEKFQNFKQFETVQDFSEHYYFSWASAVKQPPKNWAKRIQEEWRILEKDLPDTILVRVYESRMDLLRAVIVGAEGTPYHDGVFFFDIFFPSGYPNVPPQVHYHSGGLRINPNLYNCGKVCLSLLNTWSGSQNEKWIPGVSTMLQVLVSIQALILNENPYFNEPGYEDMCGLPSGDMYSRHYNENVFTLSLKTMVYAMRKPPEHFEDFVVGHFFRRAQDILLACEAYLEGARVGCLAEGGAQSSDAVTKCCSDCFKDALASYIPVLVQTFSQVGAKDCEKFLSLADKGNSRVSSLPVTSNLLISKKLKISRHK